jgi:hypothetical protein
MFETMQPPTRGAVVKRYGIELTILAQEGLSVEFGAMFALVDGWRFNEPTLRFLFGRVFEMRRRHDELTASFNTQQFQGGPIYFTPRAPFGIDDHGVLGAADEIAAHDLGATAYAGAVVLVLTGLLQACKADMKATSDEWNGSGPLIEGCSIGAVPCRFGEQLPSQRRGQWTAGAGRTSTLRRGRAQKTFHVRRLKARRSFHRSGVAGSPGRRCGTAHGLPRRSRSALGTQQREPGWTRAAGLSDAPYFSATRPSRPPAGCITDLPL